MDLPNLVQPVTDASLARTFRDASGMLEREGRRALGSGVFRAGGRMRSTAAALLHCATMLDQFSAGLTLAEISLMGSGGARALLDLEEELVQAGGFLRRQRPVFRSYRDALARVFAAHARASLRPPRMLSTALPEDIQGHVDTAVAVLGDAPVLDRHPAFDMLTSWLEFEGRLLEVICDGANRFQAVDRTSLREYCAVQWLGKHPTAQELTACARDVLGRALEGDTAIVGDEYPIRVMAPVRTTLGEHAVIGCLFTSWNSRTPVTWDGLFRNELAYRVWLRGHGFFVCGDDFDALSSEEQLALWSDPERENP